MPIPRLSSIGPFSASAGCPGPSSNPSARTDAKALHLTSRSLLWDDSVPQWHSHGRGTGTARGARPGPAEPPVNTAQVPGQTRQNRAGPATGRSAAGLLLAVIPGIPGQMGEPD